MVKREGDLIRNINADKDRAEEKEQVWEEAAHSISIENKALYDKEVI